MLFFSSLTLCEGWPEQYVSDNRPQQQGCWRPVTHPAHIKLLETHNNSYSVTQFGGRNLGLLAFLCVPSSLWVHEFSHIWYSHPPTSSHPHPVLFIFHNYYAKKKWDVGAARCSGAQPWRFLRTISLFLEALVHSLTFGRSQRLTLESVFRTPPLVVYANLFSKSQYQSTPITPFLQ